VTSSVWKILPESLKTGVHVVVVIPALNEAATIGRVVADVSRFGMALVVDDGSSDGTGALAREAGARILTMAKNSGYEAALDAGFAEADRLGADIVITFDADNQFAANLIETIAKPIWSNEADIVIGNRGEYARFSERLFGMYSKVRFGIPDALCGLKGYRIDLYRRYGRFDSGRSVGTELAFQAIRNGARRAVISTPVRPREGGAPRFGQGLRANMRILTALGDAIRDDLKHWFGRKT